MLEAWLNGQTDKAAISMGKALLDNFGDVSLPQAATAKETTPVEIKRFSQEQREALEKQGYVIYGLTGQSIRTLRDNGRKFWSTWHQAKEYEAFESKGSAQSEVAINPNKLFIKDSNYKTLEQQEDAISKLSTALGKKVKGVEAVMGSSADYVELAFTHLDATGERLFGEKYDYNYARTKTPTAEGCVASVGSFGAVDGLSVSSWYPDYGDSDIFAAPLVVPTA